jgi:spore coat assembly protein
MEIEKGDIVVRISYGKDVFFKIVTVDHRAGVAQLKGIDLRLCADAPLSDLVRPGIGELANYRAHALKLRVEMVSKANRARQQLGGHRVKNSKSAPDYVNIPGTVLHLDGDPEYMGICKKAYDELQMVSNCFHISEENQPDRVEMLLQQYKPDFLVITGHDGMIKGDGGEGTERYHSSGHFVAAVTRARAYQSSKDDLVIFAGACQSWYQGLIGAGANFASSPERVLIHCLDPVLIAEKVAYTPVAKTINIYDTLVQSVTGLKGVGGIESRGQFRVGLPKLKSRL